MANRVMRYRLTPQKRSHAAYLSRLAGAGRYVWNELLARNRKAYEDWKAAGEPEDGKPDSPTFFTLGKQFTQIRNQPGHEWLKDYAFAVVRQSSAKRLAEAFQRFFAQPEAGFPRFRGRWGDDSFTIPAARVRDDKLWVPMLGWLPIRRRGSDPYAAEGDCRQVTVKRELGKWYAYVTWRVPDEVVAVHDNGRAVGVDVNAGQVATSDGDILVKPEADRLESRWHRYQRRLARQQKGSNRRNKTKRKAAKTARRLAQRRADWQHKATAALANAYGTVAVEDLRVKAMTKSGRTHKRGLNRVILDTGWHGIYEKLAYKAANVMKVNPRNTSRTCHNCGHCAKTNRKSQALFRCGSCGYEGNADVNAALNILHLALGTGAAGRGRGVGAVEATPTIRQIDSLAWGLV